jgi:hypothetical protein
VHRIKDRIPPALALYLLSPVIGELLSGSAPPAEFFTPFGFTVMTLSSTVEERLYVES